MTNNEPKVDVGGVSNNNVGSINHVSDNDAAGADCVSNNGVGDNDSNADININVDRATDNDAADVDCVSEDFSSPSIGRAAWLALDLA